jgi:class 3 adenylate cyclase
LAERILTLRSVLEGERKQVTVLFADIKGSLELLADRDPEEARKLLDPILKRMMEAVHRYEGTVNQVLGDGIMALFGAPIAHEDHAARAGYAALKMQEAIGAYADQLQRQRGISVQIRVGLNAGEVVVRGIGNDLAMDYTAVGQTTHLAARMEQLAEPGTIVVTAAFARLTEGYLRFEPLGPVSVKGLAEPLEVFALVGAEPARMRFQTAAAYGLSRFVGRQTELQALHAAAARAGAGCGQAVAVIGEPGVGKSRLVYEFTHSLVTEAWLILETSCVSYGKDNPYLPIRNLLRAYFQIDDRDDERSIQEKVDKHLTPDVTLWHIRSAILALLDVSIDEPEWQALDAHQRRLRMLDSVKRLLLRQSQSQLLLVIVENLHWLDASTQTFLDSLIESLPAARLLLLVSYRLEYQHTWSSKTYYTQLRLDPLRAETAEELLCTHLGDASGLQPVKRFLIERTEGNPFFLEESIRTLVETGVLAGERGAYRLAKPLSSVQVPARVQAILAARIDRLPPEEKHLLQCAAVIGKEMTFPLLQAIADVPDDNLHLGLAHLQAAEFLYESNLFPEIEHSFKHALTQEVAYASLLQERRRALHARIVDSVERLYSERLAVHSERLAFHAFRGELWTKAVAYFRQAAVRATTQSAYREAVVYLEQALAALQHLPEGDETFSSAIDLRMELTRRLVPLADYGRILENLREVQAIAEAQGDRRRLGLVCSHMTDYFRLTGNSEEAIAYGERALTFALELEDFSLKVLAHQRLGHACHAVGDYRRAIQLLKQNVTLLRGEMVHEHFGAGSLPSVLSRAYMVFSLVELGEFTEALLFGEEAMRIADEADTALSQVLSAHAVGLAYLYKGDFDRSLPLLEQTLQRCQVGNIPIGTRLLASTLGYAYALTGGSADAVSLLEQAVQQTEALKVFFRYALWLAWWGEAYLLAGRIDKAFDLAQRAVEHARIHKEPGHQAYGFRLFGEIAAQGPRPDVEKAEAAYRQALMLADALGMRPLQAHCQFGVGVLYHRSDQPEQAKAELVAAERLFRSLGMTFWAERTQAVLAMT